MISYKIKVPSIVVGLLAFAVSALAQRIHYAVHPPKPRILVSTDIGGTDPDDNQSMIHLLMYSDLFDIEGLVSSPSFGDGSKQEILRMIDLYARDYKLLKANFNGLYTPRQLRKLCKQGQHGLQPVRGYSTPTEGSEWIVKCARRKDFRPLYVLVWGALDDLAQALHDAPDIAERIRVYYIGGPNKKWGVNAYSYIAENFPNLWMIENNASYRGFITDNKNSSEFHTGYYDSHIKGHGSMGADFVNYYKGIVKMGDSPSLFYLMNGNPDDPTGKSWGGQFAPISHSPRTIFTRPTTETDTVATYSVVEFVFDGPSMPVDSIGAKTFTITIDRQQWQGEYMGAGKHMVRYSPKAPARLTYVTSSPYQELHQLHGTFSVSNPWPGQAVSDGWQLGDHWYTDLTAPELYKGVWQGFKTTEKWREDVLRHWARRWAIIN